MHIGMKVTFEHDKNLFKHLPADVLGIYTGPTAD
jgi:hypothetical protein